MSKSSRSWCFTLNNPTNEEWAKLLTMRAPYWVCGDEVGESGTPHVQGYVQFGKVVRFSAAKQFICDRAHLEPAKGTPEQASDYCKKDGKYQEFGELSTAKKGGDMEKKRHADSIELAKKGEFDAIAELAPDLYLRYYSTYKRIRMDSLPSPEPLAVLDNYWYYGETGTGKSRRAREENPGYYLKNINKWWDGYIDQPCVIIEEWSPHVVMGLQQKLKEWADHHPFTAEVKGGTTVLRPPKIIVTSNYRMEECFLDPAVLEPIKRRFKFVIFPFKV